MILNELGSFLCSSFEEPVVYPALYVNIGSWAINAMLEAVLFAGPLKLLC